MSAEAVLLVAFGGPERPEDVRPFLERVARGRSVPAARLEEVARHYARMPGGRSPFNERTRAQAQALERRLAEEGPALPVFVGLRHAPPFLHEALGAMRDRGVRRAVGVVLSPLRCEASWDRYVADAAEARARVAEAPELVWAPAWADHPRFIAALAARTREAFAAVPEDERAWCPLVFTAHSVPVAMADRSPYVADLTSAARAVAVRLQHERFSVAYQSRSGDPRERWLEPDVGEVLRRLAAAGERHAVVVPVGFVCDHVEVLYDLDVEARAVAAAHGLAMHRAATVGDHPEFIALLAELVQKTAR